MFLRFSIYFSDRFAANLSDDSFGENSLNINLKVVSSLLKALKRAN